MLDSPLTTVKQRDVEKPSEGDKADAQNINQTIEPLFWDSIAKTSPDIQIIILDYKEPRLTLLAIRSVKTGATFVRHNGRLTIS